MPRGVRYCTVFAGASEHFVLPSVPQVVYVGSVQGVTFR